MSINQDIRFKPPDANDPINPDGFYQSILNLKPAFNMFSGVGAPDPSLGSEGAVYIDTSTNTEYLKKEGAWTVYFTFSSGSISTGANLGGVGVYDSTLGSSLLFKGLTAGTNITLTPSGTDITIDAAGGGGTINSASNLGVGEGVFTNAMPADNLNFRSLVSSDNIEITPSAFELTFGLSNTLTNISSLSTPALGNLSINSDDSIYLQAGVGSTIYPYAGSMYCGGLSSGITGVKNLDGLNALPLLINSDQWITLTANNGTGIDFSSATLDCTNVINGIIGVKSLSGQGAQPLTISSSTILQLTAQGGFQISMSGASLQMGGVTGGIFGLTSLNNSSSVTDNRLLNVSNTGVLSYRSPPVNHIGVCSNMGNGSTTIWWTNGATLGPADGLAIPISSVSTTKTISSFSFKVLYNANWILTSALGTMKAEVGYIISGQPAINANFVVLGSYNVPVVNNPEIFQSTLNLILPLQSSLVCRVVNAGATSTSGTADAVFSVVIV